MDNPSDTTSEEGLEGWNPVFDTQEALDAILPPDRGRSVRNQSPRDRGRVGPRSLGEWLRNPILLAPLEPIIDHIAFVGRATLLAGREKSGKSTLLSQAVAAVSVGGTFLGRRQRRARVLWYCIDEGIADCVVRFRDLGGDLEQIVISDEVPTVADMRSEATACGANLIVVDTLSELWRGRIRSENDADEVSAFLDPYIRSMRDLGIAIVFFHHTPKNGRGYRGSGAIGAKVDHLITIRPPSTDLATGQAADLDDDRDGEDDRRILEGRGRRVPHFALRLSFDGTRYALGDAPQSLRERVLDAIPLAGATTRAVRDRVRGNNTAIGDTLKQLEADGVIRRADDAWVRNLRLEGSAGGSGPSHDRVVEPASRRPENDAAPVGTAPEPERNRQGTEQEIARVPAVPTPAPIDDAPEPLDDTEVL